ncbi:hypothetical protein BOTBODRAFT_30698 [Botryobasidium botryosum FD-172 SS1]|uniref:Cupin 2 conserved barrel domain-containing protein n=1 Tax=Botryobasidium botryosum (strain FD-172 SS1) TaxID=930990 RepID=A0A067MM38_BOTB1|nr:hypothetical protein BOTBODRAFT_30698 [Botryobasidium botryosum FD-172 SS1]
MSQPSPTPPLPAIPRTVTGHSSSNASTVIFNDNIAPQERNGIPGVLGATLWTTDRTPADNSDNESDAALRKINTQFGITVESGSNILVNDFAPGAMISMSRMRTVDYNILISGQIKLILDDGSEITHSQPGAIIIQRGTMHAWVNPSSTGWTRMISIVLDAHPLVRKDSEPPFSPPEEVVKGWRKKYEQGNASKSSGNMS